MAESVIKRAQGIIIQCNVSVGACRAFPWPTDLAVCPRRCAAVSGLTFLHIAHRSLPVSHVAAATRLRKAESEKE